MEFHYISEILFCLLLIYSCNINKLPQSTYFIKITCLVSLYEKKIIIQVY